MGPATMDLAKIDPDTCNNVLGKYGLLNNAPATIYSATTDSKKCTSQQCTLQKIDSQIMDSATTVPATMDSEILKHE